MSGKNNNLEVKGKGHQGQILTIAQNGQKRKSKGLKKNWSKDIKVKC